MDVNDIHKVCRILSFHTLIDNEISSLNLKKLINSLLSRSVEFIVNEFNEEIGYVCWANTNDETICHSIKFGSALEYPYEWEEGEIVWLQMLYIHDGKLNKFILKQLISLFHNKFVFINGSLKHRLIFNSNSIIFNESSQVSFKTLMSTVKDFRCSEKLK